MLKEQRKQYIIETVEASDFVKINTLQDALEVTEMTIWRDLNELEKEGKITRVHGGVKKITIKPPTETYHIKQSLKNIDKKRLIGKKAADLIQDNDIIFISAGTTNECIQAYIGAKNIRVITNCYYTIRQYFDNPNVEPILIGGKFSRTPPGFFGAITNDTLSKMRFSKAFMGTNGICENHCSASNDDEGSLYKIVLDNSDEKYVLCDSTKFNKEAFYQFYACDKLTAIITDEGHIEHREEYEKFTKLL